MKPPPKAQSRKEKHQNSEDLYQYVKRITEKDNHLRSEFVWELFKKIASLFRPYTHQPRGFGLEILKKIKIRNSSVDSLELEPLGTDLNQHNSTLPDLAIVLYYLLTSGKKLSQSASLSIEGIKGMEKNYDHPEILWKILIDLAYNALTIDGLLGVIEELENHTIGGSGEEGIPRIPLAFYQTPSYPEHEINFTPLLLSTLNPLTVQIDSISDIPPKIPLNNTSASKVIEVTFERLPPVRIPLSSMDYSIVNIDEC